MAQMPEKVLAWLYSVLHDYYDPQRTYSDAARALSIYPNTIHPRTEVYTSENGASALLLVLYGNLPVAYKGTTYRFPIKVWIPQTYPQEAPMVYVTPGTDMLIRPGQHVGVDGRVYLPYLRDWSRMWDRASVGELLEFLQQAFAKEPPVISRTQQQQFQQRSSSQSQHQQIPQSVAGASPAVPQLPPKQRLDGALSQSLNGQGPPPRPPKPGDEYSTQQAPPRDVTRDGPPLPPLPHEVRRSSQYQPPAQGQNGHSNRTHDISPDTPHPQRNGSAQGPPLPPLPPLSQQQYQLRSYQDHSSPVSPISAASQNPGHLRGPTMASAPQPVPFQQPPLPQQYHQPAQSTGLQPAQQFHPQHPQAPSQAQAYPPQPYPHQQNPYQQPPQPQKAPPPPDLLSDPFDVALPGPSTTNAPAPPIPPNPEKEHLLHALSTTLTQQAHEKISQNLSAIAPLQAQHNALLSAQSRLEAEIRQLEHLSTTLDTNEAILHRAIQDCDATIKSAKSKPAPPIDDVLIAPTLVAQQLWTLTAEEAAIREAMYVLQRGVDRGRIGADVFVKQMRGLGREAFLKMALARKIARGMGLDMNV